MREVLLEKRKGPLGRKLYSVSAESAEELASIVQVPSGKHFVLFLAWDATGVPDRTVHDLARQLARNGLAYIVAWGPDCERVHDLFDDIDIEVNPESNSGSDTVIMSTWHDDVPLEEALWFSLHSAYPAPPYDQTAVATIAAAVGNADWSAAIHEYLTNPAALDRAIGL